MRSSSLYTQINIYLVSKSDQKKTFTVSCFVFSKIKVAELHLFLAVYPWLLGRARSLLIQLVVTAILAGV